MPRISFTTENQVKNYNDYPKLTLDKGERARICLVEPEPMMKYCHSLNMPVVLEGVIQTETRTGKRGPYEVNKTDFAGMHQCLGKDEILDKDRLDPKNCISCKNHQEHPEWFEAPKRRFAQHIIKYQVQPGKFTPQVPFQVELLAWVYANNRFDQIVEIANEHGDPRAVDLNLGPCEAKMYQKYEINVAGKCEWIQDDSATDRKKLVVELMTNNKCADLESLIAKKLTVMQIQMDLDRVKDRWGEVGAADKFDNADSITSTLAASSVLDDIFTSSTSAKATMPASHPMDDEKPAAKPVKEPEPAAEESAVVAEEAETVEKVVEVPAETAALVDDFDSILSGL